jgi:hypothetical protein
MRSAMAMTQIVSGNRGTELSDTKISNSPSRLRNLNVHQSRLYINDFYTKTSKPNEHDSYLPSMLPTELGQPLVHYLANNRHIETILSRVMGEDED